MAHHSDNEQEQDSNFWFGLALGGAVGSAALYFLGTKDGRDRMRKVLDTVENLDEDTLEHLKKLAAEHGEEKVAQKVVSDIGSVLDKIESTIPSKKDLKKYFEKDGKSMK